MQDFVWRGPTLLTLYREWLEERRGSDESRFKSAATKTRTLTRLPELTEIAALVANPTFGDWNTCDLGIFVSGVVSVAMTDDDVLCLATRPYVFDDNIGVFLNVGLSFSMGLSVDGLATGWREGRLSREAMLGKGAATRCRPVSWLSRAAFVAVALIMSREATASSRASPRTTRQSGDTVFATSKREARWRFFATCPDGRRI